MNFQTYKDKLVKRDINSSDSLRSHLTTYLAVNIGLFLLNMLTSAEFPWFLFVTGGWGIGMASHWGNRVIAAKNLQEINKLEPLTNDELKSFKGLQKSREGFYLHLISNVAVALFLTTINIITSAGFFWAAFPIIGMSIGVVSHWGSYSNKKRRNDFSIIDDDEPETIPTNIYLSSAQTLKESIIKTIEEIRGKFKHFAEDLLPKIDQYVDTIALLVKKEEDLNNSLKSINKDELLSEKGKVQVKKTTSTSAELNAEYDNFIQDIDNHIATIDKLTEQREILHIKISTSINSLKHLNLELVGMKSKTTMEDRSIINDFEQKSNDLSIYYKDLLESYDELMS